MKQGQLTIFKCVKMCLHCLSKSIIQGLWMKKVAEGALH